MLPQSDVVDFLKFFFTKLNCVRDNKSSYSFLNFMLEKYVGTDIDISLIIKIKILRIICKIMWYEEINNIQ